MAKWEVTVNGWRWTVKASESWTAVTRCVKAYQKMIRARGLHPRYFKLEIKVERK